jgi:predicted RNA methylase
MFIAVQIFVLLVILGLLYLLTWFSPKDSPWSPWWATSAIVARKVCRLVKLGKKDVLYELGSGTGTMLLVAAKEFKVKKAIGIESDASRVWWSKVKLQRNKLTDVATVQQKDFFAVDLSPATVVYFYLVPRVIEKLKPKLLKDLKPGTKVVSYVYQIDYLPVFKKDIANEIYIYEIKKKQRK